eukprot:TRINITY_DN41692_c0_g1_i1.p1 TRINITY_DN41692_c0_g1~~TRINITY_DN41692_c0_g1_i1.p1  ORF type:complete len:100 (+),score=7.02 TRINITY_DN41692_c0_g1_i1:400-699(+)
MNSTPAFRHHESDVAYSECDATLETADLLNPSLTQTSLSQTERSSLWVRSAVMRPSLSSDGKTSPITCTKLGDKLVFACSSTMPRACAISTDCASLDMQ